MIDPIVELARMAALDVMSGWSVSGAAEWAQSGRVEGMPRRYRDLATDAAMKIETRMRQITTEGRDRP